MALLKNTHVVSMNFDLANPVHNRTFHNFSVDVATLNLYPSSLKLQGGLGSDPVETEVSI